MLTKVLLLALVLFVLLTTAEAKRKKSNLDSFAEVESFAKERNVKQHRLKHRVQNLRAPKKASRVLIFKANKKKKNALNKDNNVLMAQVEQNSVPDNSTDLSPAQVQYAKFTAVCSTWCQVAVFGVAGILLLTLLVCAIAVVVYCCMKRAKQQASLKYSKEIDS
jgi:Flp pilus assembly protein TadB